MGEIECEELPLASPLEFDAMEGNSGTMKECCLVCLFAKLAAENADSLIEIGGELGIGPPHGLMRDCWDIGVPSTFLAEAGSFRYDPLIVSNN